MEQYNKKTNHELLKEIQISEKEHNSIKEKMINLIDQYNELEKLLIITEEKYINITKLLKERM